MLGYACTRVRFSVHDQVVDIVVAFSYTVIHEAPLSSSPHTLVLTADQELVVDTWIGSTIVVEVIVRAAVNVQV